MSEPKVIGALRSCSNHMKNYAVAMAGRKTAPKAITEKWVADSALLDSLAEALASAARLQRCAECDGHGGVPGGHPDSPWIGCAYCRSTGNVVVLPASLLTTEED